MNLDKIKKADQLRSETDRLELKVKALIEEFVKEVGNCDISIDTDVFFSESVFDERTLIGTSVKVHVTV